LDQSLDIQSINDEISNKIDPIATEMLELARHRKKLAEMKEAQMVAANALIEDKKKRAARRDEEKLKKEQEKNQKKKQKEAKEKELLAKLEAMLN
jgi:hypothetical protein